MIIIGEKINGVIPSVGEAIRSRNSDFIRELAIRQTEAGAGYIDVCAGTDPQTEFDTLKWLVEIVENAVDTPICIDSPDAEILSKIIPLIRREGIVNSVSEEHGKCDFLFPIIANTGWQVIALTCDDRGIPGGTEQKADIASLMIEKAKALGIAENRIYIDALVMAASAANDSMLSYSDTIRLIRNKYKDVHFTSGLTNISYGMPMRKLVNRTFLVYAMQAGMDSAIMDPTDRDMTNSIYAANVLLGNDRNCRNFNKAYRSGKLSK